MFSPQRHAMEWMKKNKRRDMTKVLGGVMDDGLQKDCVVIEMHKGGNYTDYIFRNKDKQEYKQRCWGNYQGFYKLGATYDIIILTRVGDVRIEGAEGRFSLVSIKDNTVQLTSKRIGDLYAYARNNKLKMTDRIIVKNTLKRG